MIEFLMYAVFWLLVAVIISIVGLIFLDWIND